MKTRTLHRIFRSLSRAFYTGGVALLIASLVLNFIPVNPVRAASGSIWTTIQPCSVVAGADQDKNHYMTGETVVVRGEGFLLNTTYTVTVTGNPGGSSQDSGAVVATVDTTTDSSGYFCVDAYTIPPDDWGEYTVDTWLNGEKAAKNDNYRVNAATEAYLSIVKTASPNYTKTYTWTINKEVDVSSHNLLLGESAVSNYTVTTNRTLVENWSVAGTITITNPSNKNAVNLVSVTDSFNGVSAAVSCPTYTLEKRGTVTCTYSISGTGTPVNGNNVATVTTEEGVPIQGASSVPVAVVFPAPTIDGYETVSVTDSIVGSLTLNNNTATYSRTFTCDRVGTTNYPNTATIVETGQSDNANVAVTCNAHPSLQVSKTAAASFTRTYSWLISKVANPTVHNLMNGGSGTSNYTVTVDQQITDSNIQVVGSITLHNPATIAANITSITDSMTSNVVCPVTLPYQLAAGASITCTYVANPATTANGTNFVAVSTSGLVGGGNASAPFTFGAPTTTVGYSSIVVSDTNQTETRTFTGDGTWTYSKVFACDIAAGQGNTSTAYPNTAEILETGQTADASVLVNCSAYAPLSITKTAVTSYTRTHNWEIFKNVDIAVHNLLVGQSAISTYKVDLVKTTVNSEYKVDGVITITNNAAIAAAVSGVQDSLPGAVVNCGVTFPYALAAGATLECTYSAPLPNANATTNTATVTTTGLVLGNTSAPVAVTFGAPTTVVGYDAVTVSDPMAPSIFGPFDTSNSVQYPHTFTCPVPGSQTVDNTATIVETGLSDSASVAVNCSSVPTVTPTPSPTSTPDPTSTPLPTDVPTLPPPPPTGNTQVLIPVTGADLSMPAPLGNLQTIFGNLGLALLGIGLVLQGLSKKLEE